MARAAAGEKPMEVGQKRQSGMRSGERGTSARVDRIGLDELSGRQALAAAAFWWVWFLAGPGLGESMVGRPIGRERLLGTR